MEESNRKSKLYSIGLILWLAILPLIVGVIVYYLTSGLEGKIGTMASVVSMLFAFAVESWRLFDSQIKPSYSEVVEVDRKNIDPETEGVRPDSSFEGLTIDTEDIKLSQLSPKELASTIMNSPNWQSARFNQVWDRLRPYFKQMYHLDKVSERTFEAGLLVITSAALILMTLTIFSFGAFEGSMLLYSAVSSIYPDVSISVKMWVVVISVIISSIGFSYFGFKQDRTCNECRAPFSLVYQGSYFKPENQERKNVKNGDQEKTVEVTYGVYIYSCEDCGCWSVKDDSWSEDLTEKYY